MRRAAYLRPGAQAAKTRCRPVEGPRSTDGSPRSPVSPISRAAEISMECGDRHPQAPSNGLRCPGQAIASAESHNASSQPKRRRALEKNRNCQYINQYNAWSGLMNNILPFTFPKEAAAILAEKAKEMRLSKNYSRKTLSEKSGVSEGSLKRFETTGEISFVSLLKIAFVLDCMDRFNDVFQVRESVSIEDIMRETRTRKRGRE